VVKFDFSQSKLGKPFFAENFKILGKGDLAPLPSLLTPMSNTFVKAKNELIHFISCGELCVHVVPSRHLNCVDVHCCRYSLGRLAFAYCSYSVEHAVLTAAL